MWRAPHGPHVSPGVCLGKAPQTGGLGGGGLVAELCLTFCVPGTSVVPSGETGVLGDFWCRIKGAKYRFTFQDGTWDIF